MKQNGINLSVNINTKKARSILRRAKREGLIYLKRGLEMYGTQIVFEARQELTRRKTSKSSPTGGLAQSIGKSQIKKIGGNFSCDIFWGLPYGRILEFGPRRKRVWTIRPKEKQALAWVPKENIQFAGARGVRNPNQKIIRKWAVHKWDRSQLRPHMKPALKKVKPKLTAYMRNIGARVF